MIKKLAEIESALNPCEIFKYKNTTSWINVKNYLYAKSLPDSIKEGGMEGYISVTGVYLIFLSIVNYVKLVFRMRVSDLYVGAGSGLFYHKNTSLDSYIPTSKINNNSLIYLLSADLPEKLIQHRDYLKSHNVIIVSYLLAPLKIILTNIFKRFIRVNVPDDFFLELKKVGVLVKEEELSEIHARFIISYHLYKIFLLPLRISKGYVVSAYSNTELISILRERCVEVNELQHGLIGSIHRAYNYKCHSQLLPTPDNVFVYNNFWKKELEDAGYFRTDQIKVLGRLKYSLIDFNFIVYGKRFVVFTGQGGFYDELLKFFIEAEPILLKNNVELFYIPHPNEGGEKFKLFSKRINNLRSSHIVLNNEHTTEQYIYNSIAHVSVYSSCHFDSIHYKKKTYIFDVMQDNPMYYYTKKYPEQYILLKDFEENIIMENKCDEV